MERKEENGGLNHSSVTALVDPKDKLEARDQWGNRAEFFLSCVGLSVGIGNVWRFPYLAYDNGGGVFLIPYTILLILIGKPMYMMELTFGQYSAKGPTTIWKCSPITRGVGAAMVVISIIVAIYYNVIVAYTFFYIAASFASEVPWAKCNEWWGADEFCFQRDANSSVPPNGTTVVYQSASEQYWNKYVLNIDESGGIHDIGQIQWGLALCLLLAWILVYLCLFKGIKSSGKVVYFTATFPYVILLILLVRGVTLEGAGTGIYHFFVPKWEQLANIKVWIDAANQMFYSLGIGWGSLIMFGSYSKFKQRTHIDAMIVSILDYATSIIAGVVIFSVLGALAHELDRPIEEVVRSGQGLAFIAYPEALARLPIPQLWSVLFFFMLFTLGLDSEFATLETVLTAFHDEFPKTKKYKAQVCLAACAICFLLGLPCVTSGGQFVLNLMDSYGGGYAALLIGASEVMAVTWFYGLGHYCDDMQVMLGHRPNWYWRICWTLISPIALLVIFIYGMSGFSVKYENWYTYPDWANGLGWFLLLISILQVPVVGAYVCFRYWREGRLRDVIKPDACWGPADSSVALEREKMRVARDNQLWTWKGISGCELNTDPSFHLNSMVTSRSNGHTNGHIFMTKV